MPNRCASTERGGYSRSPIDWAALESESAPEKIQEAVPAAELSVDPASRDEIWTS